MVKPICVPCGLFFRPAKNGFIVEEGKPDAGDPVRWSGKNPGDDRDREWSSYKLWNGDKWKCKGCGAEIVVGIIGVPLNEHYREDYETVRQTFGGDNILFVHDC